MSGLSLLSNRTSTEVSHGKLSKGDDLVCLTDDFYSLGPKGTNHTDYVQKEPREMSET